MAYEYTWIDGQRVEVSVARAFNAMKAAFKQKFGLTLIISSGTRTREEQWKLYNAWVAYLNGGPKAPLAAKPDGSNHQQENALGPRALDLRDSGSDAGVTVAGTARANWLKANCSRWGFKAAGYTFSVVEPWHYEWQGTVGVPAGGEDNVRSTRQQQEFLASVKLYPADKIDGEDGPLTRGGTETFQGYVGAKKDGLWGPETDGWADKVEASEKQVGRPVKDIQLKFKAEGVWRSDWPIDGIWGNQCGLGTIRAQRKYKLTPDAKYGPVTDTTLFKAEPEKPTEPEPDKPTETELTPDLVSPTAADFPDWIKFDVVYDQQFLANADTWNTGLYSYYGRKYDPIESHTHWWGTPGQAGTHDGNVQYLTSNKDVGANFVVSAGRITLTMPLNKLALTTGQRNPYAWKSENDPLITTSASDLGYRTLGYLHYIVEKLNPRLKGEPIRLHKEFYSTQCSNIDVAKVRAIADLFASGELDPETGLAPVDGNAKLIETLRVAADSVDAVANELESMTEG